MSVFNKQIDITRNIKWIEWIKGELLSEIADLFKTMAKGIKENTSEVLTDIVANIIILCYILGRRLGVDYQAIDLKVESKLRLSLIEGHELEEAFGDLSALSKHMNGSRNMVQRRL